MYVGAKSEGYAKGIRSMSAEVKKEVNGKWEMLFAEYNAYVGMPAPALGSKICNWKCTQIRSGCGGLDYEIEE